LRGLALLEFGFRGSDARIEVSDFLWESGQAGANVIEPHVHALQFEEVLENL